jgi:lipooligosaccharide transport system permease protein
MDVGLRTGAVAAPPRRTGPLDGARAVAVHFATVNLRAVRSSVTGWFLSPLMFLASLGLGLGQLVDERSGGVDGVPYLLYVAPAIVVNHAMMLAVFSGSYPVMNHFTWAKTFFGMINTPVTPGQILAGYAAVSAVILTAVTTVFVGVAALFGAFRSWWALAGVPVAVLTGLAFLVPLMAYTATLTEEGEAFNMIFRLVMTPLMLFSGTFYPITTLPVLLQAIAWVTPLWHGVELSRGIALHGPAALAGAGAGHLLVLLAYVAVGAVVARWTFRARLVR